MRISKMLLAGSLLLASQQVSAQDGSPDRASMQLASSIILELGAGESFDSGLRMYRQSFIARLSPVYSAAMAARLVDAKVMPEFISHKQDLLDIKIRFLASQFSLAELRQINSFYASSVGQKFASSQQNAVEYATTLQRIARVASQQVDMLQEASAFIPKINGQSEK